MDIKVGQRFKFNGTTGKFICEVTRIRDSHSFAVKVLQDLGWGRTPGYVYEDEDLTRGTWEYLPGQDAPPT
jgi:hypothetical protein